TCISVGVLDITFAMFPPTSTVASAAEVGKFAPCSTRRPPGASKELFTRLAALLTEARMGGVEASLESRPVVFHSPFSIPGRRAFMATLTAPEAADAGVQV